MPSAATANPAVAQGSETLPDYVPGSSSQPVAPEKPKFETAEEEKKRLEREERERLLAAGGSSNTSQEPDAKDPPPDELPPYQEF
ncbi:hypothetical protein ONZ51_g10332 [Trametes cubensis]|uniref:Uncharacterized protein n=1 Tax=Trametes cubensis TaxID=1111947 RepID=A0AAD7X4Y3_9APHY|nr:hypothetical protein ONZ51_g10332 [Trametes cubensis]